MAVKKKAKKSTATKTTPAKKAAASKSKVAPAKTGKTPKKTAAAKKTTASKASGGQALPRNMNEHGFVEGSDSAVIVDILLEGVEGSRSDMYDKIKKAIGRDTTRSGNEFNVSSTVSNLIRRLEEKGYVVEASWKLLPPTPASKAAATRRAKAAAKKEGAAKPAKKAAKKAAATKPAKKAAKRRKAK